MTTPCPPRGEFLIGWMSSRDTEVDAASDMLDEEFTDFELSDLPSSSDSNHYIPGRIGNHNIVIICFSPIENPQVAAAIAATSAKFTFPSLQHVLLVGVASGFPRLGVDIRLGDVTIGMNIATIPPDVTTEANQWPPLGQLSQPNTLLRNAVRRFRSTARRAKPVMSEYLAKKFVELENLEGTDEFKYPLDRLPEDKLSSSSVAHSSETVDSYDGGDPIARRQCLARGPELFCGLILSGNFNMQNDTLRDAIASKYKAICWDRESVGVMAVFPALVVRGIQDYADSHSEANRGAYETVAAARAAIFAKELLKFLPRRALPGSEKQARDRIQLQEFTKVKQLITQPYNYMEQLARPDTTRDDRLGQIFCLWGDDELPIDPIKKASAAEWFNWLRNVHNRVYREPSVAGRRSHDRVKIAILDTGIDLSKPQRDIYDRDRTMQYKSWLVDDARKPAICSDDVGHGTHLATVLARVAPKSIIHVARVFKNRKPNMDTELANISRAIRYSVDMWDVDIIVMSFGFEDEHDEGKDSILQSIRYAAAKGVSLFAAASNDGKNRPDNVSWPARAPEVICVHSGDGLGSTSPFTPAPGDNERIMVLGECVLSAWPERFGNRDGQKYMSGTSCAAPIAAGIAALVLDYAKRFLPRDEWRGLLRTDRMQRLFERMAATRTMATGYWWIRPWDLLGKNKPDGWIVEEIRQALR